MFSRIRSWIASTSVLALLTPGRSALAVLLIGLLGLLGWVADIPALRSPQSGQPMVSVNTALSMLLCGGALLLAEPPAVRWRKWLASLLVLVVMLFAGATSLEYLAGIDPLFLHWPAQWLGLLQARPLSSPYGAPSFLLLSTGLLLQLHCRQPWLRNLAQGQVVLVVGLSLVVLFGHLVGQAGLLGVGSSNGTAFYSALGFLLLAAGLFNRDLQAWPARLWYGHGAGSLLLRRLSVPLMALLLLFFILGLGGQTLAPVAAHTLIFIFSLGICWVGLGLLCAQLNREERQRHQVDQQFAELFEGNPDGLLVVDARGMIARLNRSVELLTGYARSELIGESLRRLLPQGSSMGTGEHGSGMEITLHGKSGEEVPVNIAFRSACIDGQLINILAIRDLRAHKRLLADLLRMRHAAGHDSLTSLLNRALLAELLDNALLRADHRHQQVAVCFCDLDGFKAINDNHGHAIGDALLVEVAQRIRRCVRQQDLVARPGGDEFIIVLTDLDSAAPADRVARAVLESLSAPYLINGLELHVSVSIGISLYPQHGLDREMLLQHADQALYAAKHAGKRQICHYPPEFSSHRSAPPAAVAD